MQMMAIQLQIYYKETVLLDDILVQNHGDGMGLIHSVSFTSPRRSRFFSVSLTHSEIRRQAGISQGPCPTLSDSDQEILPFCGIWTFLQRIYWAK
jgi:hypothetical protein